mgnify:FL=1
MREDAEERENGVVVAILSKKEKTKKTLRS